METPIKKGHARSVRRAGLDPASSILKYLLFWTRFRLGARNDEKESLSGKTKVFIGIALVLILLAVILRLVPHPPNFAPIAAMAIFGGALLPRRLGLIVPLAAIVVTDFIIGTHDLILVTWGSYALIALASSLWLRRKLSFIRGAALTLGASVFFFITTNFAVWLTSGMYERTWAGLAQCFAMALPFFRNTLASDLIYTAALFGAYALAVSVGIKLAIAKSHTSNI